MLPRQIIQIWKPFLSIKESLRFNIPWSLSVLQREETDSFPPGGEDKERTTQPLLSLLLKMAEASTNRSPIASYSS